MNEQSHPVTRLHRAAFALSGAALCGCEGEILEPGYVEGAWAFGVIWGATAASLIVSLYCLARRHYWLRLAADADGTVQTELREGPAVLAGRVAREEASAVARVDIRQEGTEEKDSSGDWRHQWTEKERHIWARPFEMELDTGERVRVEPPCTVSPNRGVRRTARRAALPLNLLGSCRPVSRPDTMWGHGRADQAAPLPRARALREA